VVTRYVSIAAGWDHRAPAEASEEPKVNVPICIRCAAVTIDGNPCRCSTPHDPIGVRRRHREAVTRARMRSDGHAAREHTPPEVAPS
jgi:hypothetical protein